MADESTDDRELQLRVEAWQRHPDRAVLLELSKRRDAAGHRTWMEVTRLDPTDARVTNLWLQPIPEGKSILIGRWLTPENESR